MNVVYGYLFFINGDGGRPDIPGGIFDDDSVWFDRDFRKQLFASVFFRYGKLRGRREGYFNSVFPVVFQCKRSPQSVVGGIGLDVDLIPRAFLLQLSRSYFCLHSPIRIV